MPRAIDLNLEQSWRRRFQEFQRSGLSVREYCSSQAIREHTFFWWRRELAKRDRMHRPARANPSKLSRKPQHSKNRTSAFLPVQLISEPLHATWMEIRLGELLLRVPMAIDEPALRQVLRVVREEVGPC